MMTFSFQRAFKYGFASLVLSSGGCGDGFLNSTSSLGGDGAGSRGSIRVIVINNTQQNAALTLGTFDQGDPNFLPDATQIGLDDIGLTLGPNSQIDAISFRCARVFSVGGRDLLDLVEASFEPEDIENLAIVDGAGFFDVASDSAVEPTLVGSAQATEALLGLDFNCGSILIVRLEINELGVDAFRIGFEVIPSASGR